MEDGMNKRVKHKPPVKPAEIPAPPPNAIPAEDNSFYDNIAHCNCKGPEVPYEKKFALEKRYNMLWSGMAVPQYKTDFTEAAYIQRFGMSGQEVYGNVLTLRGIAIDSGAYSPAAAPFINTLSALLFSEQITPEQVRGLVQAFNKNGGVVQVSDKTDPNKKPTEKHNPAAWTKLNEAFLGLKIPIAFHTKEMIGVEGVDGVCMKRYYKR